MDKFVCFQPFMGVGPRRFFDLFSMRLGSGYKLRRKDEETGKVLEWREENNGVLRSQLLPCSYLELEHLANRKFNECLKINKENEKKHNDHSQDQQ